LKNYPRDSQIHVLFQNKLWRNWTVNIALAAESPQDTVTISAVSQ
jgi:hypothetical protein